MLFNRHNFIIWGTGLPAPEPEMLLNIPAGSPIGRCTATVLLVPGETSRFFLNAPNGLSVGDLVIDLVKAGDLSVVAPAAGTMTAVLSGLAHPQYQCVFVTPAGLPENYYRFRIQSPEEGTYYYSNRLWYKPSGHENISAIFAFRNRRGMASIPYHLPDMVLYRQILRLKVQTGIPQTETEVENYRQVTTQRPVTVRLEQDLAVPFSVSITDEFGHEGFRAMLQHRDILVNFAPFVLKTGYQAGDETRRLQSGSFELYQIGFSTVNQC